MGQEVASTPTVLREGEYSKEDLDNLKNQAIWQITDLLERQALDLFEVEHPEFLGETDFHTKAKDFAAKRTEQPLSGDWVYFPWSGYLIRCATESEQFRLRTNRNKNLVTDDEQAMLANAKVAIAGMSVGGQIAVGLAYSGIANSMTLADHDVLETPNLNRVRASLSDIGESKTDVIARQVWSINPYAKLDLYSRGINDKDCDVFLNGAKVVFDEIDDFKMKIVIRHRAKQMKVPVLMMTGLGDSVLIDVERYDLESNTNAFNGLIGGLEEKILNNKITPDDAKRYAAQIIGIENVPTRALQSLLDIGSTLVGRPQLGSTVSIESGIASFLVRQIVLGAPLKSGRYRLSLTDIAKLESEIKDSDQRNMIMKRLMGA